jgi:hypothetical protein
MASSFSTDLKIELMATGENSGTWGDKTNSNLNLVQQAIAGYQSIALTSTNTTLAMTNATISDARNAVLEFTGTITANCTIFVESGIEKTYLIKNSTSGAFTIALNQVGGSSVIWAAADKSLKNIYLNGTNATDTGLVSETGVATLTQKTLTTPTLTSPIINEIDDNAGNEFVIFSKTTTAVNEFTVTNAATGNAPEISATGGDTNIDLKITPKGSGKINLDGIKFPNADGSNGQVLSTDGSGNLAFTTISSSPAALKSNITLKTAASITAGKLASINSSGEIVNLPTLNTYGTVRTNSSNTGGSSYTCTSLDGSTALSVVVAASSSTVSRATFYGAVISNSTTPTNGTTTTNDIDTGGGWPVSQQGANILPIANNKFMVMQYSVSSVSGCCSSATRFFSSYYIITVDATTGNVTKGAVVTSNPSFVNPAGGLSIWYAGQINKDILINYASAANGLLVKNFIVTWSGTTVTITTDTTDVPFWGLTNGFNSLLTSSNILCQGVPNTATWRTASWTAGPPPAIGTKTDTTMVGDYYDNGAWWKMEDFSATGASYVLFTYRNTSLNYVYNTFSIDQTTGALTSVETGNSLTKIGTNLINYSVFKNSSNQVYSYTAVNSVSWTNGVVNGFNAAGYITNTNSPIRLNSSDLYYLFNTNTSNFPTNQGYTVNAYSTDNFNYVGVVETTTSSSPASIVTDGVAANFTSLTPGTVYYATTPLDGTVATSTASGILVGKAISSTQILLQRSNTQ